jgi:hypothetical protein
MLIVDEFRRASFHIAHQIRERHVRLELVLQRCRTYGAASGVASFPEMIGERVFVRNSDVEDGFEFWPFRRKFRELERAPFAKADEEDAFAMLRHDALRVYDAVVDVVFQVFGQRLVNDAEGAALSWRRPRC